MKNWFRATEWYLFNFSQFPAMAAARRARVEDIREGYIPSLIPVYELREGQRGNTVSSPVEKAAIKIADDEEIKLLEKEIRFYDRWYPAVRQLVDKRTPFVKKFIAIVYIEQTPPALAWEKLGYEKSQFYREKQKIVRQLAIELGFLHDVQGRLDYGESEKEE